MNTTTLRGVFPEPKAIPRKNFLQQNIRQLRQLQGLSQADSKSKPSSQILRVDKYQNVAARVNSHLHREGSRPTSHNVPAKGERTSHRGVQTERPEDVPKLYEKGVVKYSTKPKARDRGDQLTNKIHKLELDEKHDYVRQNKQIKTKPRRDDSADPTQPPADYQKGVVPKYIQERKQERQVELPQSAGGLVLLPDEERKEYLRVARENYAVLIKELNGMPVSNDTLKKRKRKMEIEEELKRLDEVIKIFQKPKVFVKADS